MTKTARAWRERLVIGIWHLFGIWDFGFGASDSDAVQACALSTSCGFTPGLGSWVTASTVGVTWIRR
jgi:hypothetical protein